jgi:hypothetical protein
VLVGGSAPGAMGRWGGIPIVNDGGNMKKTELDELDKLAQNFIIDFEPISEIEKELIMAKNQTLELIKQNEIERKRLDQILDTIQARIVLKIFKP